MSEITTDPEINAGHPTLEAGYTVIQILKLVDNGYSKLEAAERLDISVKSVEQALRYYRLNKSKVDELRQEEREIIREYRNSNQ